jgi:hypothetical protein
VPLSPVAWEVIARHVQRATPGRRRTQTFYGTLFMPAAYARIKRVYPNGFFGAVLTQEGMMIRSGAVLPRV